MMDPLVYHKVEPCQKTRKELQIPSNIYCTTPRSTTAAAASALTGRLAVYTLRVIGNYPDPK